MNYVPGSHLIATLKTNARERLEKNEKCFRLINEMVIECQLKSNGEIFADLQEGGFTFVISLKEGQISLHSFPEYGLCNLDIYMSNFEKVNDETVTKIFHRLVVFFDADVISQLTVSR